jgi:hypothetical protein
MANTFFKSFAESDRTSSRTLLHEAIPITGTIVSGAYTNQPAYTAQNNIKSFTHGMFKSVYDYPYLSSSANQIFDISCGFSANSWAQSGLRAIATLTVADGDAANGMTEGEYVLLTSTDGTTRVYVICNGAESGASATGVVMAVGADTGASTLDAATAALGQCVAVQNNLSTHNQGTVLNEIRAAVVHANGHNGKITATAAVTPANDEQTITFTQATGGVSGNATITTTISQITVSTFAGGHDKTNQEDKKSNMYTQMAQILAGFDTTGSVRRFDADGNYSTATDKHNEVFFMNFSRLLVKDEIKKGSFSLTLGTASAWATAHSETSVITDAAASTNYKINSPAGEFGILKRGTTNVGLLYYQAGIAVLTGSVLGAQATTQLRRSEEKFEATLSGSTMDIMADAFSHRIKNISFNNTTELNSTIYFCRANHNEFNYSSNPTYLSGSKVVVKSNNIMNPPRAYATTVGLYSADNELLAVAKLSEPLRKDPTNELTLRVRLDY